MRFASVDKVEATEQFAHDTDDPVAALATFRQVLDESLLKATEGFLVGVTRPWDGVRLMADAVAGLETLCRGLCALVERVMEPYDEDTWRDFLRDEGCYDGEQPGRFGKDGCYDDAGDSICPDHGPLVEGRCYECEHIDLTVDLMLERRAFGE